MTYRILSADDHDELAEKVNAFIGSQVEDWDLVTCYGIPYTTWDERGEVTGTRFEHFAVLRRRG